MSFEVHYTSNFAKAAKALAKRYRSFKSDLSDFIDSIESNPFQGDELTPGIRNYSTVNVAVLQKITKSIETDTGQDTE